ncbi:MAG: Crp/Fnr family transcriptional regulator [Hyphomicrobiaceae bacterium]
MIQINEGGGGQKMLALQDVPAGKIRKIDGRRARDSVSTPDACGPESCGLRRCALESCPLLEQIGKLRTFAKSSVIFWDGDTLDNVFLVVSGVVRGTKILSDGRRQITRFAFPGEIIEYSRNGQMPYSAEAITDVRVVTISRHHLDFAMNATPCLRRLMMGAILEELQDARAQVLALGRLSATERVARFLLTLQRHLGQDDEGATNLPMSRQDIADYLGLTIETVSRVVGRLKRDGKIRLLSANRVAIHDLDDFLDEALTSVV